MTSRRSRSFPLYNAEKTEGRTSIDKNDSIVWRRRVGNDESAATLSHMKAGICLG